jgi:drug/metabolite transporter (DMT)-like permease
LAIFPSVLAYQFFNEGVKVVGATVAGLVLHLIPVFGSIMAVLFLGEKFRLYHVVGMLLILGGIFLVIMHQIMGKQKKITEKI